MFYKIIINDHLNLNNKVSLFLTSAHLCIGSMLGRDLSRTCVDRRKNHSLIECTHGDVAAVLRQTCINISFCFNTLYLDTWCANVTDHISQLLYKIYFSNRPSFFSLITLLLPFFPRHRRWFSKSASRDTSREILPVLSLEKTQMIKYYNAVIVRQCCDALMLLLSLWIWV